MSSSTSLSLCPVATRGRWRPGGRAVWLPPRAGGPALPRRRRVRLTRRGRLVFYGLLAGLLAAVLAGLLSLHSPAGVAAPAGAGGRSEVVVQPGGTLWSLAVRHDPSRDPFATIEEIRRINQLRGYTVHPGQTLRMP